MSKAKLGKLYCLEMAPISGFFELVDHQYNYTNKPDTSQSRIGHFRFAILQNYVQYYKCEWWIHDHLNDWATYGVIFFFMYIWFKSRLSGVHGDWSFWGQNMPKALDCWSDNKSSIITTLISISYLGYPTYLQHNALTMHTNNKRAMVSLARINFISKTTLQTSSNSYLNLLYKPSLIITKIKNSLSQSSHIKHQRAVTSNITTEKLTMEREWADQEEARTCWSSPGTWHPAHKGKTQQLEDSCRAKRIHPHIGRRVVPWRRSWGTGRGASSCAWASPAPPAGSAGRCRSRAPARSPKHKQTNKQKPKNQSRLSFTDQTNGARSHARRPIRGIEIEAAAAAYVPSWSWRRRRRRRRARWWRRGGEGG
jgi:hypothetical protein